MPFNSNMILYCTVLKWLGDFNIAKSPSIITKSVCSGRENESMTRIKEHPSYKFVIEFMRCRDNSLHNIYISDAKS